MAELSSLSYRSGSSLLHRFDVRFKIFYLSMISVSLLFADGFSVFLTALFLLICLKKAGIPVKTILLEFRFFLVLFIFLLMARALSIPGVPIFQVFGMTATLQGINDGAIACGRLADFLLMGILFVSTTRPTDVKASVEWWLAPIPMIQEKRAAIMLGIVIRFIPLIMAEVKETMDAQKARGIENRKNPFFRIVTPTIPILRKVFQRADELVAAMEARCWSEDRTGPVLSAEKKDWLWLFFLTAYCVFIILSGTLVHLLLQTI